MRLVRSIVFFYLLSFIACGGQSRTPLTVTNPPVTLTSAQVYIPSLGTTWTFKNAYGEYTWITQQSATPSDYLPVGSLNWVFQKNSCRAYWGEGICDALLHFVLVPQPDGSWTSPASLFYFPTQVPSYMNGNHMGTSNFAQVISEPMPYVIIPASATLGVTVDVKTDYDRWDSTQYTFNSIISGSPVQRVSWRTVSYIEYVVTPVYIGQTIVSEQFESACIHEKWYFAPGLGLVKIEPLDNGSCTPADPNLTIVRIN